MPYTVYVKTQADAAIAAAIAALVNSSPAALDTLKELADALGDDANFAATMTTALAGKVPTSRAVNGKPLSADVTLAASDVSAVATSAVGAVNGVAGLDANGHINYAALAAGASFHIASPDGGTTWKDLAGNTLAARPTARTDVRMMCETSGTTLPSWAITGDLLLKIGS